MHTRPLLPATLLFAAAALAGRPATAQLTLLDLQPAAPPSGALDHFGSHLAPLGDLDGDGVQDFAIAVERGLFGLLGHVQVTSGATRLPIATLFPFADSTVGINACGLGDVDLDGFPDLAVGAPKHGASDAGFLAVYSGRTLGTLRIKIGNVDEEYATSLASLPDMNFDGVPDYLVGLPGATVPFIGYEVGAAHICDGTDGSLIQSFYGTTAGERFGQTVAALGDAHFGALDFSWAAGAPGADRVEVYYGFTHQRTLTGASGSAFGSAVCGMDDLDFDGLREVAVGANLHDLSGPFGSTVDAGRVVVFDGQTGAILREDFGGTGERRGMHLADALDVDGDGRGELLVGGLERGFVYDDVWDSGAGPELLSITVPGAGGVRVAPLDAGGGLGGTPYAVFGFPLADTPDLDAGEVQVRFVGPGPEGVLAARLTTRSHATFGAALAMLGDVDGDGTRDLAVGIPFDDREGAENGTVEVRSGATGATLFAVEDYVFFAPGAQIGTAVANAGDLTGDGIDDIVAGGPRFMILSAPAGIVRAYSGANGDHLWDRHGEAGGLFGAALDGGGDFDGDGVPDVLVGEPQRTNPASGLPIPSVRAGFAHVLSGANGTLLWSRSVVEPFAAFGTAVAWVGDVDGDGFDDIAATAPTRDPLGPPSAYGSVEVYSQASADPLWSYFGSQADGELGAALAVLGDVDLDGVVDLAVGAPGWDADGPGGGVDHGRVVVLSGADGAVISTIDGLEGERLGAAVAAAGDVDKDGRPDVAAGLPGYKSPITFAPTGRVRVYDASTGAVLRSWSGTTPVKPVGAALAGGDLDGDGDGELLAGAPTATGTLEQSGAARLYSTHALGTAFYGLGTAGCADAHALTLSAAAEVGGVADFRCSGIAPGLFPTLALATAPDVAGSDPLGLGALMHVDLPGLLVLSNLPATTGTAPLSAPVPVPNNPALAGLTLYAQIGFYWGPGVCGVVPAGFSSSSGLELVIQP